jgi:DNA-binding transcriptional LysR family regulator
MSCVPEDVAQPHLAKGRLRRVLDDWCPPYPGYHLYYPSRRQATPAFALFVAFQFSLHQAKCPLDPSLAGGG